MNISDKVSAYDKVQPNTVIIADLLNGGVGAVGDTQTGGTVGFSSRRFARHFRNKRALLDALAEAMLAENHTHSVPATTTGAHF